jgi:threonine dehydratase
MALVDLQSVREAAARLEGVVHPTPMEPSRALSSLAGATAYLKCENLQRTGAFKIRGAYNRLSMMSDDERARGVVCASAGNHAQGVALAAGLLGVRATVFMPEGAALPKVEATGGYGATVRLEGSIYDEAAEAADAFSEETGAVMVHPFDHIDVIAGQGTVGLEILDALPEVGTVLVPIGGGGLIAGIAAALKQSKPSVRVVGVEPEGAKAMKTALEEGHVVTLPELHTVADGLAAKEVSELTLAHAQKFVDEVVTVTDDDIAEALLLLLERAKLLVEPSGAAAAAAVLRGKTEITDPCVVLASGGNVDPLLLLHVIRFGMVTAGRYFSFRTRISDRPGELYRLLGVIAQAGANVVGVEHHREGSRIRHLDEVEVAVQVETRGPEVIEELTRRLESTGYRVERL